MNINSRSQTSGEAKILVRNKDGSIIQETDWIKNMTLHDFLVTSQNSGGIYGYIRCYLTNKTTAASTVFQNKVDLDDTYEWIGNTFSNTSGSPSDPAFNNGEWSPGDWLQLDQGQKVLIQSIDSATSVTVFQDRGGNPQTHSDVVWYRCGLAEEHGIDIEINGVDQQDVVNIDGSSSFELDYKLPGNTTGEWLVDGQREQLFQGISDEVQTASTFDSFYVSQSLSSPYARIVLPVPIDLLPGNTVEVAWRYKIEFTAPLVQNITTSPVTGWPYEVEVEFMQTFNNQLLIETKKPHYFEVGDQMLIQDSIPFRFDYSVIVSNGTLWTITLTSGQAAAPDFSAGDVCVIEGSDVVGYDGAYTIDSITSFLGNYQIIIANTNTFANASSGTARLQTPTNYFNNTWTVTGVDGPTEFIIDPSTTVDFPYTVTGKVSVPNANYTLYYAGKWGQRARLNELEAREPNNPFDTATMQWGVSQTLSGWTTITKNGSASFFQSATVSNGYNTINGIVTINEEANDYPSIGQLMNSTPYGYWVMTFDHFQSKPNTQELTFSVGSYAEPGMD